MNLAALKKQIKSRKTMIIMSISSLAFIFLSYIVNLVDFLTWYMDNNFNDFIVSFVANIIPPTLLVLYVLRLHKNDKAKVLIPIIWGLLALISLYYLISTLRSRSIDYMPYYISTIAVFAFAMIYTIKGFFKENLLIVAIAIAIIAETLSNYNDFEYIGRAIWFLLNGEFIVVPAGNTLFVLGRIALYIALLLVSLNNTKCMIPQKNLTALSPEQALKLLKNKFESGIISEEEYLEQRAEIIAKL